MRGSLPVFVFILAFSVGTLHAEEGEDRSLGVRTGLRGTVGTGGYAGRSAYLQLGNEWRVRGSYSDFQFTGSTGTTRTAGLRTSYQGEHLAAGLTISLTPRNDAYANRSFGVDGGWVFLFDEDADEAPFLTELELGGWWSQTRHSQIVPPTPGLDNERNIIINQHDFGLSTSLTAWDITLSLDASRTVYDKNFLDIPLAARRKPRLGEAVSLARGFPERNGSVRLEFARWLAIVPYVSFAATRYELQPQPAIATAGTGASFRYNALTVDLGYEVVRQKGAPDNKYFNFGGSVRF